MKYVSTVAIAAVIWATAPVQAAEKIDLSSVTCKQFFEYSKENISLMMTWLDGFYKDEEDDPIVDFDKVAENTKKLGEYCGKRPNEDMITAAEKLLGK